MGTFSSLSSLIILTGALSSLVSSLAILTGASASSLDLAGNRTGNKFSRVSSLTILTGRGAGGLGLATILTTPPLLPLLLGKLSVKSVPKFPPAYINYQNVNDTSLFVTFPRQFDL